MVDREITRKAKLVYLPTGGIEISDRKYAISWPGERGVDELARKIGLAGMVEPVWVEDCGCVFRVVDGFGRLAAARRAGIAEVPALVFPADTDPQALMRARLRDVAGRITAVETARLVDRLAREFQVGDPELVEVFLPLLGFGPSGKILADLRRLAPLEEPVARWCAEQGVGLREALLWAAFPREGQRAILVLVRSAKPGGNLLRSYLRLVQEISVRDSLPVQDVLFDRGIREVLTDPQATASGGREKIHRILLARRYPLFTELTERFERLRREMNLPEGVGLEAPPNFEGDRFTLSLSFGSVPELARTLGKLIDLVGSGGVDDLFELLGAPEKEKPE